jgi:hypothetical protein
MKNFTSLRLSLLLAFLGFAPLAWAQAPAATSAVPGYWNTETNLTTRAYTIVRFYNGQDQLVYEEFLSNFCLDLSRRPGLCRRTKSQLDETLQRVLRDPALARKPTLLATQFGQDRRVQRVYAAR